jgi:UDPglucose 6-dehydrogenase
MRVSIIGTGYVGLVTGVCLAEKGHSVVCVDIDAEKIKKINDGIPPIYERGLQELLQVHIGRNFCASTDLQLAVMKTDLTFITVGTPYDGNQIDLSFVEQAAQQLGQAIGEKASYHVVAVKSTVVPGTTDDIIIPILEKSSGRKAGREFGVGMNPEFLTEGQAIDDFMHPDRIVLGGLDRRTADTLAALYSDFEVDKLTTNNKTAEMIKYASNSLLATMISFSNEIANLCAALGGIDAMDVMKGVHLSHYLRTRISNEPPTYAAAPISAFLVPGCGFGGSCLPKDVSALVAHARKNGGQMPLLAAVIHTNQQQPEKMLALLKKHYSALRGIKVAVLGLAFKPDTDDIRESPSISIIRRLTSEGATVKAYDPIAKPDVKALFGDVAVEVCSSLAESLIDIDAALLVTRWEEFRTIPALLARMTSCPLLIDGRRMLDKNSVARYEGIGF